MRAKSWLKVLPIVAVLCVVSLPAYAQQQGSSQQTGDPVADAARKAREQKKNAQKPKKVYTEDDVSTGPVAGAGTTTATAVQAPTTASSTGNAADAAAAVPTPASATSRAAGATPGAQAQPAADAAKGEDPNSEKAWRKRFSDQNAKIAKAEKELDILGRELEKSQMEYYPDPQKAMTQQNTRGDINGITAKIDAKKKELDQLRQGLNDLEDQLRKSGGDPGWAR